MLELLLLLLDAPEALSRARIFDAIPAYRTVKRAAGERKFERDKKDLRELGVPLAESSADAGVSAYSVDREAYELPEVDLDEEERAALVLAAEAVRATEGLVYRDLVDEALHKLVFERGRGVGADLPPNLAVAMPPRRGGRTMRKLVGQLAGATEGRKRVRITYASRGDDPTDREVDPHALVFRGGDWLLVGHCHLRRATRTFRVDRMGRVRVAARPGTPDFERPDAETLALSLTSSPWAFDAGTTQSVDVVLEIGPERRWAADEDFGEGAAREPRAEGWTRVSFRSGNLDYVVTRVLDGAVHLRVVAPEELRARVIQSAQAVADLYPAPGRPSS
jgi:proteasome accessory factor B